MISQQDIHEQAFAACTAALKHARDCDYRGHNKHDGLNSPLLRALSLNVPFFRLAWTQVVTRAPVNLRPLLRVPKTENPKGHALFAMAYLDLFRATQDEEYLAHAETLLDRLKGLACREMAGIGWGYPYPWQDKGFFAPRHFPNRVVTSFVGQAFLSAHDVLKRDEYAEVASSICEFLLDNPRRLRDSDEELCLSYVPSPDINWIVMDVSILAGAILARTAAATGDSHWLPDAERLVRYVVNQQTDYAAWYYSDPPSDSHITHDNYHTGFILDAILDYTQATGDEQFMPAWHSGLKFYDERLFEADGAPRWMYNRRYPHDVHGAADGILTFSRAADLDSHWLSRAEQIATWSLRNLYQEPGRFAYQQTRFYTKRFNLLRWCNGWMARGLASLLVRYNSSATSLIPEVSTNVV